MVLRLGAMVSATRLDIDLCEIRIEKKLERFFGAFPMRLPLNSRNERCAPKKGSPGFQHTCYLLDRIVDFENLREGFNANNMVEARVLKRHAFGPCHNVGMHGGIRIESNKLGCVFT